MTRIFSLSLTATLLATSSLLAQEWHLAQPAGSPQARRFHTLAQIGTSTYLFGGTDERNGLVFGDTWRYERRQWTPVIGAGGPSPRSRFAACVDPQHGLLLFGGADAQGNPLADTWRFDGTSWTSEDALPGAEPTPRIGAAMAFDAARGVAVLFGGHGGDPSASLGDTLEFAGGQWVARSTANAPSPRHGHAMTHDSARGVSILYGGLVGSSPSNETWEWDGTVWRRAVTATTPPGMVFPAMTFFAAHGLAVLTGGSGAAGAPVATFVFDGTDWSAGPAAPTALFGRQGHALAYDGAREHVVLFGGASIGFGGAIARGDTWQLGTAATFEVFGSGCDAGAGELVLDAANGALPLLGGDFAVQVAPAAPLTLFAIGLDRTQFGGRSLPVELSPFGMPGCSLFVALDAVQPALVTGGVARGAVALPLDTRLLALPLFVQALSLDPATGAGATSNAGSAVLGS